MIESTVCWHALCRSDYIEIRYKQKTPMHSQSQSMPNKIDISDHLESVASLHAINVNKLSQVDIHHDRVLDILMHSGVCIEHALKIKDMPSNEHLNRLKPQPSFSYHFSQKFLNSGLTPRHPAKDQAAYAFSIQSEINQKIQQLARTNQSLKTKQHKKKSQHVTEMLSNCQLMLNSLYRWLSHFCYVSSRAQPPLTRPARDEFNSRCESCQNQFTKVRVDNIKREISLKFHQREYYKADEIKSLFENSKSQGQDQEEQIAQLRLMKQLEKKYSKANKSLYPKAQAYLNHILEQEKLRQDQSDELEILITNGHQTKINDRTVEELFRGFFKSVKTCLKKQSVMEKIKHTIEVLSKVKEYGEELHQKNKPETVTLSQHQLAAVSEINNSEEIKQTRVQSPKSNHQQKKSSPQTPPLIISPNPNQQSSMPNDNISKIKSTNNQVPKKKIGSVKASKKYRNQYRQQKSYKAHSNAKPQQSLGINIGVQCELIVVNNNRSAKSFTISKSYQICFDQDLPLTDKKGVDENPRVKFQESLIRKKKRDVFKYKFQNRTMANVSVDHKTLRNTNRQNVSSSGLERNSINLASIQNLKSNQKIQFPSVQTSPIDLNCHDNAKQAKVSIALDQDSNQFANTTNNLERKLMKTQSIEGIDGKDEKKIRSKKANRFKENIKTQIDNKVVMLKKDNQDKQLRRSKFCELIQQISQIRSLEATKKNSQSMRAHQSVKKSSYFTIKDLQLFGGVSESYDFERINRNLIDNFSILDDEITQCQKKEIISIVSKILNIAKFKKTIFSQITQFLISPYSTVTTHQVEDRELRNTEKFQGKSVNEADQLTGRMLVNILLRVLKVHQKKCKNEKCCHVEYFLQKINL